MINILHIFALGIALMATAALSDEYQTGLMPLAVEDSRADRPLEGFFWYPTASDAAPQTQHGNAVWQGIQVIPGAVPASGKRPLVLLSHGMYGNAMNQSWLADTLVREGYVVAAINHPGTSTWLRDPDQARQLWDRPRDISRLIDYLLDDAELAGLVDSDRIYMAGHSLGGFTAVALAGGRFDTQGFGAFCAAHPGELVCGIFDRWQVAKTPEDSAAMEADLSDPRIRAFAVFDLGGTRTFSAASLAGITAPMLVLGAPNNTMGGGLDLDVESRALVAALDPKVTTYLEPSSMSHFDFMGVCTSAALAILAEEEPDDIYVCKEGREERMADHALIASSVIAAFQ